MDLYVGITGLIKMKESYIWNKIIKNELNSALILMGFVFIITLVLNLMYDCPYKREDIGVVEASIVLSIIFSRASTGLPFIIGSTFKSIKLIKK